MDGRCFTLLAALTAAGITRAAAAPPFPDQPDAANRTSSQLLVLVDGQVVRGSLKARPDGYEVTTRAGRTFIESARVQLLAEDLTEAYQKLVESRNELTPESHVKLARWCIDNNLQAEAARELLDALRLDPQRGDARQLLVTLDPNALALAAGRDRIPSAGPGVTTRRFGRDDEDTGSRDSSPASTMRSIAGLKRTLARDFTRHVQPLLMSKCATTGCHGATSPSAFRLISTHRGSTASVSEKNLGAVLQQLNAEDPVSSPLLKYADMVHGDMTQPAFRGRVGTLQRQVLIHWLEDVGEDLSPKSSPRRSVDSRFSATAEVRDTPLDRRKGTATPEDVPVHGSQRSRAGSDREVVAAIERDQSRDPFHPAHFNLRRHGRIAEASGTASSTANVETLQSATSPPASRQPLFSPSQRSSLSTNAPFDERVRP